MSSTSTAARSTGLQPWPTGSRRPRGPPLPPPPHRPRRQTARRQPLALRHGDELRRDSDGGDPAPVRRLGAPASRTGRHAAGGRRPPNDSPPPPRAVPPPGGRGGP